ncbi:MAG: GTPase Era [Clostridia bacterium]
MTKCGYVAIVGRPNAGKSTLTNALVGQKVAIVTSKAQTTRDNIIGVLSKGETQFVFVDTPGIHPTKTALDKQMMKSVRSALGGVDVVLYLVDGTKSLDSMEMEYLSTLVEKMPVVLAVSKTDLAKPNKVFPLLTTLSKIGAKDLINFSSLKNINLDLVLNTLEKYLPQQDFIFDKNVKSDKEQEFQITEIVREKLMQNLQKEIPYGIKVELIKYEERPRVIEIHTDIICLRKNHKSIIIGKGGGMLKTVGSLARVDIEHLLGKKVLLKLWVVTKEDWINKV